MSTLPFDPPRTPMEARVRDALPTGSWAYEPKWDGFRVLAWAGSGERPQRLDSRKQRPLLRYFPELEAALRGLPAGTVVDGEVVVVIDGRLDFDALQQRIHPADSRIRLLAEQTPAELVAFDLLADRGADLREQAFEDRRARLVELAADLPWPWHLTPSTTDPVEAQDWFERFESAGCDGLVCKRLDGPYREGARDMVKLKHRRTVDCVVGGFREHKDGGKIGSILLGLFNDGGELHFIGHCSGFSDDARVSVLERLQPLAAPDSFGADARRPGAPSRWTGDKDLAWVPVRPELVVEVSYDQLTGERFRHATRFSRWRTDKDPQDCTFDQLERPSGPTFSEIAPSTPAAGAG